MGPIEGVWVLMPCVLARGKKTRQISRRHAIALNLGNVKSTQQHKLKTKTQQITNKLQTITQTRHIQVTLLLCLSFTAIV
ncbi:hypothetical protein XELAEV_18028711mg [Xenopus laevis]|uniref:Uncharacterized protein n=1 Tax=Xenopus laevis TaxID=8355 RepID=A0A974CQ84_XENLA|nr:hypothetical protein XELAEV_18028711mg [Xenopus laevis]